MECCEGPGCEEDSEILRVKEPAREVIQPHQQIGIELQERTGVLELFTLNGDYFRAVILSVFTEH